MRSLRKQEAAGERRLPALRKRLTNPVVYLALFLTLIGLAVADSFRSPDRQITAAIYVRSVGWYQYAVSPRIGAYVKCRYRPTCSTYSLRAVQRFGIGKGVRLTADRLFRCRSGVPMGTVDPVPDFR